MRDSPPVSINRRRFLQSSAAAVAAGAAARFNLDATSAQPGAQSAVAAATPRRPVLVGSANALRHMDAAMAILHEGKNPLDAVLEVVTKVEDDPGDHSVGLGGIPNEDGVVELDASVMHGPTHKAGAVAAIRNIRNPSLVARRVMERTDHVLLVGEGALRFAKAHGFKEEDLLTEAAREIWLKWKESHSDVDDWLPPVNAPPEKGALVMPPRRKPPSARHPFLNRIHGTINCCAVDAHGDIAGVTTTSGLGFKIPGRVGDSPIIGAGLYVDNAIGAAGSTGRGEANLQNCFSFLIVELMRPKPGGKGLSPEEACLEALQRIADHTEPRLRDKDGRPNFGVTFYAVAKDGRYGAANMWSPAKFAVHDGTQARLLETAYLFERAT